MVSAGSAWDVFPNRVERRRAAEADWCLPFFGRPVAMASRPSEPIVPGAGRFPRQPLLGVRLSTIAAPPDWLRSPVPPNEASAAAGERKPCSLGCKQVQAGAGGRKPFYTRLATLQPVEQRASAPMQASPALKGNSTKTGCSLYGPACQPLKEQSARTRQVYTVWDAGATS